MVITSKVSGELVEALQSMGFVVHYTFPDKYLDINFKTHKASSHNALGVSYDFTILQLQQLCLVVDIDARMELALTFMREGHETYSIHH
ncbi:hypothetical protein nACB1_082 [Acinetobacter phage nACB1]|nr:hypothetical protein nACB1_082 [Acinetobacter phage nACB1]